jgi:L-ascorbate metabolism protein UlaG (beta-lactamase superfamily)
MPEGDFLDDISNPDVLFLPVGEKPVLKPEEAVKIVKKLEPKIIIPSFVHENTKEFLKILGQKRDPEEKFVFKKKDIENKVKEVVLLKAI